MFSFFSGITLSEYIRRRRLTLAALELSRNDSKVIDVALKYGYASPDAFVRAFQSMHGVTPSEARSHGPSLKAFPRMTFQLTIQGGSEMNYRIEDKEAFRIVGISKRVPIVFHGVNPDIAAMYQSLTPEWIETWAVFTAVGPFPSTLQEVWGRIYAEWFPSSDYELSEGPEILWNEHKDVTLPQYKSEIWIPIRKRFS